MKRGCMTDIKVESWEFIGIADGWFAEIKAKVLTESEGYEFETFIPRDLLAKDERVIEEVKRNAPLIIRLHAAGDEWVCNRCYEMIKTLKEPKRSTDPPTNDKCFLCEQSPVEHRIININQYFSDQQLKLVSLPEELLGQK